MEIAFVAPLGEPSWYRLEGNYVEHEVGPAVETELRETRSDPVANAIDRAFARDPWTGRGGGVAHDYSGPGSSDDALSRDLAARAGQARTRVFGHVDDDGLPVAALNAALLHDRGSLVLISNIDEIVDGTEAGASWRSSLFVLSREYHGSGSQPSKPVIDAIARRVCVALTITRMDFSNREWRPVPETGWVITDLPAPELCLSLRLAVQGHCLVPNDARSTKGEIKADHVRVGSTRMRDCAILLHIGSGKSDSTIARELGLSKLEIRRTTDTLYRKLSVSNRAGAGAFHGRVRDEIVAHRKSLIQDSESHSRRAALR